MRKPAEAVCGSLRANLARQPCAATFSGKNLARQPCASTFSGKNLARQPCASTFSGKDLAPQPCAATVTHCFCAKCVKDPCAAPLRRNRVPEQCCAARMRRNLATQCVPKSGKVAPHPSRAIFEAILQTFSGTCPAAPLPTKPSARTLRRNLAPPSFPRRNLAPQPWRTLRRKVAPHP